MACVKPLSFCGRDDLGFFALVQTELARKDKGVYYEKDCQGLHCNMFGISWDCRACYMDCAACEGDQEDLGT